MGPQQFEQRFNVSRETITRLLSYQALLGKWQQKINLVGPATLAQFWERHVLDSAQLLALAGAQRRIWLDLGSGGGFPGLVLAIMLADNTENASPDTSHVHLVESDRRKSAFLQAVIRETGAPASVHNCRIEALAADNPPFLADIQAISARALADLSHLLDLLAPFFNSSTIALLHKGRDWQDELTRAEKIWDIEVSTHVSETDETARIVQIDRLAKRVAG